MLLRLYALSQISSDMEACLIFLFIVTDFAKAERDTYETKRCSVDQYQCFDGSCIPLDLYSDGIKDCPDQSDEGHGVCAFLGCPTYYECLIRHDIYGRYYNGRRQISRDGEPCTSNCKAQKGIGVVCDAGNNTMRSCHVPHCDRNGGIEFDCDFSTSFCGWRIRSDVSIDTWISDENQEGNIRLANFSNAGVIMSSPLSFRELDVEEVQISFSVSTESQVNHAIAFLSDGFEAPSISSVTGWSNRECTSCDLYSISDNRYRWIAQIFLYIFTLGSGPYSVTLSLSNVTTRKFIYSSVDGSKKSCYWNEYQCSDGKCIPMDFLGDGFQDCDTIVDESTITDLYMENNFTCTSDKMACNHTKVCIPVNSSTSLIQECFENSILPYERTDFTCPGDYECKRNNSERYSTCVGQDEICDGIPHCPHWDDEATCDVHCPRNCYDCTNKKFRCRPSALKDLPQSTYYLDVSGHSFRFDDFCSLSLHRIAHLNVSRCEIDNIVCLTASMDNFPFLKVFDASFNKINRFYYVGHLISRLTLYLDKNPLHVVHFRVYMYFFKISLRHCFIHNLKWIYRTRAPYFMSLYVNDYGAHECCGFSARVFSCETFDISHNALTTLEFLRNFVHVKVLNLGHNDLSNMTNNQLDLLEGLQELYLNGNVLRTLNSKDIPVASLEVLNLESNYLISLESDCFQTTSNLRVLLLSRNVLKHLHPSTFWNLYNLEKLTLQDNNLESLPSDIFKDLSGLRELNLMNNKLRLLPRNLFANTTALKSLDLRGNNLDVYKNIFGGLSILEELFVQDFTLCCGKPSSVSYLNCRATQNNIASCKYLLHTEFFNIIIWFLAFGILTGTMLTLKCLTDSSESSSIISDLYLKHLSLADLTLAFFLISVGVKDVESKGDYWLFHQDWIRSAWCDASGIMFTIHMQVTTSFVLVLAVKRCICCKLKTLKSHRNTAQIIALSLWIASISISFVPFIVQNISDKRKHSLCCPITMYHCSASIEDWNLDILVFLICNTALTICLMTVEGMRLLYNRRTHVGSLKSSDIRSDGRANVLTINQIGRNILVIVMVVLEAFVFCGEGSAWLVLCLIPFNNILLSSYLRRMSSLLGIYIIDVIPINVHLEEKLYENVCCRLIVVDKECILDSGIEVWLQHPFGQKQRVKVNKSVRNILICSLPRGPNGFRGSLQMKIYIKDRKRSFKSNSVVLESM